MEILGLLNAEHEDHLPLHDLMLAALPGYQHAAEELSLEHLISKLPIKTPKIREAMLLIPRDQFAPDAPRRDSLADRPIMTNLGFNISAPHMHAMLLESLDVQPGQRVLDVGSGSGLLTAYIAYLVGKRGSVVGIDVEELATKLAVKNVERQTQMSSFFQKRAAGCTFRTGNVFLPDAHCRTDPFHAQEDFDRIVCGAACPDNRRSWFLRMLKPGGILLSPMLGGVLEKTVKTADGRTQSECISMVRFKDLELPSDWEVVKALLVLEKTQHLAFPACESTFIEDIAFTGFPYGLLELMEATKQKRIKLEQPDLEQPPTNGFSGYLPVWKESFGPPDCILVGRDWTLPAHRRFLSSRCELFRAQSGSGMRDSEASQIHLLQDFSKEAVDNFLCYCYTDMLHDKASSGPDSIIQCLEVAVYCGAPYLVHTCELILAEHLDAGEAAKDGAHASEKAVRDELAAKLLAVAAEYSLPLLQCNALHYIIANFQAVAQTQAYKELSKEHVHIIAEHTCKQLALIGDVMSSLDKGQIFEGPIGR